MAASPAHRIDEVLRRHGTRAWMLVGLLVLAAILYTALAGISGLVGPLVVATVVGMLFVPVVDRLAKRMPRQLATLLVVVVVLAVGVGVVAVTVRGIVAQAPQIGQQLTAGLSAIDEWLVELGIDTDAASPEGWSNLLPGAIGGLSAYVGSVFSSAAAFFSGGLIAMFILYFVLADWRHLSIWVGRHLGTTARLGAEVVDDATFLVRQYFVALTVSSLVTAAVIAVAAALLGVPLAFTIGVVTFATAYVPYLGAIVAGAFAALIALGSGGLTDAVTLLVVILVAQNVIQTLVQTKLTVDRLSLHPIVIFGSTIVGAALAGVIGATLSAPVVALGVRITERIGEGEGDRDTEPRRDAVGAATARAVTGPETARPPG